MWLCSDLRDRGGEHLFWSAFSGDWLFRREPHDNFGHKDFCVHLCVEGMSSNFLMRVCDWIVLLGEKKQPSFTFTRSLLCHSTLPTCCLLLRYIYSCHSKTQVFTDVSETDEIVMRKSVWLFHYMWLFQYVWSCTVFQPKVFLINLFLCRHLSLTVSMWPNSIYQFIISSSFHYHRPFLYLISSPSPFFSVLSSLFVSLYLW